MRFVFAFRDELGMATQADVMLRIEGVDRARRQAVRTAFPSSAEKQMPRNTEGGESCRVCKESVGQCRIKKVEPGIFAAHVVRDESDDQDRIENRLPESLPMADEIIHLHKIRFRYGIGPDDLRRGLFLLPGQFPQVSMDTSAPSSVGQIRNQFGRHKDDQPESDHSAEKEHATEETDGKCIECLRDKKTVGGENERSDAQWPNDGAQPLNRKMV